MNWIITLFRHYPELSIFLTLALGYWIGSLKIGKFSLGSVTGVLLVGVVIGQMQITISPNVKSVFSLMFLFAVGYGVGPQFFRGLKSDGLPQVYFAIIVCLSCLFTAYGAARIAGFDVGSAAGLLSGACTISAVIGVATDAINQLGVAADRKASLVNHIPVAYAVTYIFGTAGVAWFLASLGPRLLRVDLAEECRKLESTMGGGDTELNVFSCARKFDVRAYRVTNEKLASKTVAEIESLTKESRVFIERIRHDGSIADAQPDALVHLGDTIVVMARHDLLIDNGHEFGPEVEDFALLDFPAEMLDVVITNKALAGMTLRELAECDAGRTEGRGVFLRKLIRGGHEMPFTLGTKIDRGDVLEISGAKRDVERAAAKMGYADRATNATDMVFVGAGIVLGGIVGSLAIRVGGIPLSLSTSGGALIAGLVFGWLRSVHRTFGRVPAPALWVFNSVGLTAFIAVVGITSGPGFVEGIKEAGLSLFAAGIVVTILPMIIGLLIGKYFFKMHPGILLGACAGARTTTAALGMIQDAAKSKVPALGYTVTYAIGNTLLTIWGLVIVLLMS
ncbi:MAG: aspartate-alanine antiporter [Nitrospirae bacterium]|nr:aspartate-alanine antiporter [Nitrospirota bacterium]